MTTLEPIPVRVERDAPAWRVTFRSHAWLHGSLREALADARWLAQRLGAFVVIEERAR